MKKLICLFILLLTLQGIAQEKQEKMHVNAGFWGNFNVNMHSPDFWLYPSVEQKSIFDVNKNSLSGSFGIIANFPLSDIFVISGRIGYNNMSATLDEHYGSNRQFEASLSYLEISPVMQFHNLLPLKPLFFIGGLEFGIPLSSKYTYNYSTENSSAEISNFSDPAFRIAAILGAGYTFKLTDKIYLSPEITFRIPFTNVNKDNTNTPQSYKISSWSATQLRIGATLTFAIFDDLFSSNDDPTKKKTSLNVGFNGIRYYDKAGNSNKLEKIRVEDVRYTELFPLVPYIFYEENSSTLSQKYQKAGVGKNQAGEFSIKDMDADAMEINKHTLDIIGSRLVANPAAELSITGTRDNKKEESDKKIAEMRAQNAKDYLVKKFSIKPNRIKVLATGLPQKPTSTRIPEGDEENRRIEFSSNSPEILEPIVIDKDMQRLAEPSMIEFLPFAETNDTIVHWQLEISQAGLTLRNYEGKDNVIPLQWVIYPNQLTNKQLPVDYTFSAETKAGISRTISGSIPVDYFSITRKQSDELADKIVSKFSLILFDFDNAEISEQNMSIITKQIIPAIKANSVVKIYGYTDRTGKEDYNRQLAERRANAIKGLLESKVKNAKYELYGVGNLNALFDNDSPIGRQLSRTVQIYIVTPK